MEYPISGSWLVSFEDKRGDVKIYQKGAFEDYFFLTAEEAWQLKEILDRKLYLHEEVRIKND